MVVLPRAGKEGNQMASEDSALHLDYLAWQNWVAGKNAWVDNQEMGSPEQLLAVSRQNGRVHVGGAACRSFVDGRPVEWLQEGQIGDLKGDFDLDHKMVALNVESALMGVVLSLVVGDFCLPSHEAENSNQEKNLASGDLEQWSLML